MSISGITPKGYPAERLFTVNPLCAAMSVQKRELYSSPNGDKWFLSDDPATGNVFIRARSEHSIHFGHVTEMDGRRHISQ
jgi:hypothetical protein